MYIVKFKFSDRESAREAYYRMSPEYYDMLKDYLTEWQMTGYLTQQEAKEAQAEYHRLFDGLAFSSVICKKREISDTFSCNIEKFSLFL